MGHLDIRPAGDAGVVVNLGDRIDLSINRRVHAMTAQVGRELAAYGFVEVTPAYTSFLVSYDTTALSYGAVVAAIEQAGASEAPQTQPARRFTLPVLYGAEYGPDLDELASYHHLSPDEVIARHAFRDYPIFCLGFSPGFPFLGGLDESLHTPRLETPRSRVPAGSVAIGGSQTGVYPTATPGGWRLIGRTPLPLFDIQRTPPVPYSAGDVIRFEPTDVREYERLREDALLPVGETITCSSE